MKIEDYWNIYYCGLCDVNFAVSKEMDKGLSSCPKCESGEEVVLIELGDVQKNKIPQEGSPRDFQTFQAGLEK